MVQKKLPLINSSHGSETRNIINELIKLFNGMGYTYDEALQKAHDVLSEAQRTNRLNNNTNSRLDKIIADSGTSSTEVVDARGEYDVLGGRVEDIDRKTINNYVEQVKTSTKATQNLTTQKTIFTFIDDDGYDGVLTKLKPLFQSRGKPYVVALRGDSVILQTEQKREELLDLQNNHGWEFASHTMNHMHLNQATDSELEKDSRDFLELMAKYNLNVNTIVYPWGERGNLDVLSKYYRAGFGTTNGVNNPRLHDYHIGRQILGDDSNNSLQYHYDLIDNAIADGDKWVVYMTHVDAPGTDLTKIESVLDYIISKNGEIVNIEDGLKMYGSVVNSGNKSLVDEKYFRIKANGIVDTTRYMMNEVVYETNVNANTKPSEFPFGTTTRPFNTSNVPTDDRFPVNNGIAVTYRPTVTNGYTMQYIVGTVGSLTTPPQLLYRMSLTTGTDSWGAWYDVTGLGNINSATEESLLSDFPFGETFARAIGWSLGNGTVKTIRAFAGDGYGRQIFYSTANRIYTRSQTGSAWRDWDEIQFI